FKGDENVYVPRVVWNHTSRRVLTLEDVTAIKITDYDAITASGINRADVAQGLFKAYLKQIFEDGFFHADPHPGNIFITPLPEKKQDGSTAWKLTLVDFGMVGRMPERLMEGLRETVISVGLQDSSRLVKAYQMLGVLLPSANMKLLEEADEFMSDDLNTAKVLANFFELVPVINSIRDGHLASTVLDEATLLSMQGTFKTYLIDIFGLKEEKAEDSGKLGSVVQLLIDIRKEARSRKDFMTSDKIRNQLLEMGIQLKDEKDGGMSWSIL
ncbi:MAG: hypothetical protein HGA23_06210, partial [Bacteroidales bacterium]|nr:hypothetical protein [Bacteroidales bacterium]